MTGNTTGNTDKPAKGALRSAWDRFQAWLRYDPLDKYQGDLLDNMIHEHLQKVREEKQREKQTQYDVWVDDAVRPVKVDGRDRDEALDRFQVVVQHRKDHLYEPTEFTGAQYFLMEGGNIVIRDDHGLQVIAEVTEGQEDVVRRLLRMAYAATEHRRLAEKAIHDFHMDTTPCPVFDINTHNWPEYWARMGDDMPCPICLAATVETQDNTTECYNCGWHADNPVTLANDAASEAGEA